MYISNSQWSCLLLEQLFRTSQHIQNQKGTDGDSCQRPGNWAQGPGSGTCRFFPFWFFFLVVGATGPLRSGNGLLAEVGPWRIASVVFQPRDIHREFRHREQPSARRFPPPSDTPLLVQTHQVFMAHFKFKQFVVFACRRCCQQEVKASVASRG